MQVYRAITYCCLLVVRDLGMMAWFLRIDRHEHGRVVDATLFIDLQFVLHSNFRCAVYKKSGALRKGQSSGLAKNFGRRWRAGSYFHRGTLYRLGVLLVSAPSMPLFFFLLHRRETTTLSSSLVASAVA